MKVFNNTVVWVDVETSGFDEPVSLLEIAMVVTDNDFVVKEEISIVIHQPDEVLANVWEVHHTTGMVDDSRKSNVTLKESIVSIHSFLAKYGQRLTMAGQSVHYDMQIVKRFMPTVADLFSHRMVDARSVILFLERFVTKQTWEYLEKNAPHRALKDIMATIETAKKLRDWVTSAEQK